MITKDKFFLIKCKILIKWIILCHLTSMMINVTIYIKTSVGTSVILVIICPTVIVAQRRYPPLPWECPTRPPGNNTTSGPPDSSVVWHPVIPAPGTTQGRVSAVEAGWSQCPHIATMRTEVFSVTTPIRTARLLACILTSPAPAPASPWCLTCAGASHGAALMSESVVPSSSVPTL